MGIWNFGYMKKICKILLWYYYFYLLFNLYLNLTKYKHILLNQNFPKIHIQITWSKWNGSIFLCLTCMKRNMLILEALILYWLDDYYGHWIFHQRLMHEICWVKFGLVWMSCIPKTKECMAIFYPPKD